MEQNLAIYLLSKTNTIISCKVQIFLIIWFWQWSLQDTDKNQKRYGNYLKKIEIWFTFSPQTIQRNVVMQVNKTNL